MIDYFSYIRASRQPTNEDKFKKGTVWINSPDLKFDLSDGVYIQSSDDGSEISWIYFKKQKD